MTGSLRASAVSQLNGSTHDGIHLLWASAGLSGLSIDGFTIQRRPALQPPRAACHTLSSAELTTLHRDHLLRLEGAVRTSRSPRCPTAVPAPRDDPHHDDPLPPQPVCRDLRALESKQWPNPLAVEGITLTVQDPHGPLASCVVRDING